jgi:hypothetical protein
MTQALKPLFIIGAGRSGTNILRDVLTSLPGTITWPCDEINLVFRHGNRSMPHDEFGPEQVNDTARKYIVSTFKKLARSGKPPLPTIVEKTCANSLRVPFLNEIFPDARYIFIFRNGYDVTSSALIRWRSSIEPEYLYQKLKFVPVTDIPYYAVKFIKNRLHQFNSKEKTQKQWGPVYDGMMRDLQEIPIEQVVARQWARSFEKAYQDLSSLGNEKYISLAYEDFVGDPLTILKKIKEWNSFGWSEEDMQRAASTVKRSSVNKGRKNLDKEIIERISAEIEPVMNHIYMKLRPEN